MILLAFAACLFLFMCLFGLAALGMALCLPLKLLEWMLRLGLWLLNRYAEPQPGDIVININIVDDAECDVMPRTMRDVTPPKAKRIR